MAVYIRLLIVFIFISCETETVYVPLPQREIPIGYASQKDESIILLNNEHRESIGLHKYKTSLDLYHLAKDKVYEMHESDSLSHNGFYWRSRDSGALFFGESVAFGFVTAESTLSAYYGSEEHRQMFESEIYEYIASASYGEYNCVLVARYRPYRNGKMLEIKEFKGNNISIKTK